MPLLRSFGFDFKEARTINMALLTALVIGLVDSSTERDSCLYGR